MLKHRAEQLTKIINDLIEYKIKDSRDSDDPDNLGYSLEISVTNKELENFLISLDDMGEIK